MNSLKLQIEQRFKGLEKLINRQLVGDLQNLAQDQQNRNNVNEKESKARYKVLKQSMRDLANRQKQMEEELQEELETNQAAMKEEITQVSIKMQ